MSVPERAARGRGARGDSMKFIELSAGAEDFDRDQFVRVTLFDVSFALGHSYHHWFVARLEIDWARGIWWSFERVSKSISGEGLIEMLLIRFVPGWLDR